jgi:hypothetical protein
VLAGWRWCDGALLSAAVWPGLAVLFRALALPVCLALYASVSLSLSVSVCLCLCVCDLCLCGSVLVWASLPLLSNVCMRSGLVCVLRALEMRIARLTRGCAGAVCGDSVHTTRACAASTQAVVNIFGTNRTGLGASSASASLRSCMWIRSARSFSVCSEMCRATAGQSPMWHRLSSTRRAAWRSRG